MAVAMQSAMAAQDDIMDIDIDMDIDEVGPTIEEEVLEEGEEPSFQPSHQDPSGIIPAIYTEDPSQEPQWQKIHIRGVDDMHTNDILAFSKDHFPGADPHVQWIDDTSANIVFENGTVAREALLAFVSTPLTSEIVANAPFETRQANQLASRPASIFTVRIAKVADRKLKNAREASRYYLLHPDEDPGERSRGRIGRGENGDYKRRRFDEREHKRRRDHDNQGQAEDFSANMYDDAPTAEEPTTQETRGRDLFSRITKGRRRSASPGAEPMSDISEDDTRPRRKGKGYRDRSDPPPYTRRDPNPHPRTNAGKELFSDATKPKQSQSGGLHSDQMDTTTTSTSISTTTPSRPTTQSNHLTNAAAAKRLKVDLLKATSQTSPRPPGSGTGHRRSHAMDAKNDEDLAERFARKSISMDSTKSLMSHTPNTGVELFPTSQGNGGLNIRGAASSADLFPNNTNNNGFNIKGSGGFSIKGRAGAEQVKELFPDRYSRGNNTSNNTGGNAGGGNRGKELFDEPVRRKGIRQRAGDLFD